jgi:hypothetical protein
MNFGPTGQDFASVVWNDGFVGIWVSCIVEKENWPRVSTSWAGM